MARRLRWSTVAGALVTTGAGYSRPGRGPAMRVRNAQAFAPFAFTPFARNGPKKIPEFDQYVPRRYGTMEVCQQRERHRLLASP